MSGKSQTIRESGNEATNGGPSNVVGIPTNSTPATGNNVYYDMSPPSYRIRFLVFLRGLIHGLTTPLCCSVDMFTTDDLTWGLRISVIGRVIGGAITGGLLGFLSSFLGCLVGREIASSAGDDDDRRTGCRVGAWSAVALAICFMLTAIVRKIPKAIFKRAPPVVTNNAESEVKSAEDV